MVGADGSYAGTYEPEYSEQPVLAGCERSISWENVHYHNPVKDVGGDESFAWHVDVTHLVRILHRGYKERRPILEK